MVREETFEFPNSAHGAISDADCRLLLATRTLGRVGLTSGALPVILPVEYLYDDGVIVFRTEPDAKLRAALHGAVLAFEVDAFDPLSGRGWSVLAHGRATVLTTEHELAPIPTLDDCSSEPRQHYVRLHCEIVRGRLLTSSAN
jgi:nitroimidazol reductase NimA-like FMN-containing flavoprotein (pyridoxamine 5'-phosphate oxidase superfamily)